MHLVKLIWLKVLNGNLLFGHPLRLIESINHSILGLQVIFFNHQTLIVLNQKMRMKIHLTLMINSHSTGHKLLTTQLVNMIIQLFIRLEVNPLNYKCMLRILTKTQNNFKLMKNRRKFHTHKEKDNQLLLSNHSCKIL